MSDRSFFTYEGWESDDPVFVDHAIAELTRHQNAYSFEVDPKQRFAWETELDILKRVAKRYRNCTIALEYMIPRMGKRVDAILLENNHVIVIEFKVDKDSFTRDSLDQVSDYTFDLKNFHGDSHDRSLFPILVCTNAPDRTNDSLVPDDGIYPVQKANSQNLTEIIERCLTTPIPNDPYLNHSEWLNASYHPTPTIIEAARALYHHHTVEEISRNEAGLTNIATTTNCINRIIENSRRNRRKSICFVTGVPGAGKTLVGLNLASARRREPGRPVDDAAVFLSGNGPLIKVIRESLVEDQKERNRIQCEALKESCSSKDCKGCKYHKSKEVLREELKSFVNYVHLFRDEYFEDDNPPVEHVAIFDEAQRAWTAEQLSKKMKNRLGETNLSEPQCLIGYMDRHSDWACMICLVGGGQEINQGEAGIIEWFNALSDHFSNWDVYAPDSIQGEHYLENALLEIICPNLTIENDLHLAVDMRSFRNKNVASFAEAIVSNRPAEARELYKSIECDYPIYVTRDLSMAKEWVRIATKRPSDRYGIVADSYGQRIRADGIIVPSQDFNEIKWFLRGKDEVDSSYFMEVAASEFKIQGLEIDYAIVAWEGDYRYSNGCFMYYQFRGGKWTNVNNEMNRRYLKNGYRVLLTRARQGYVIYVPEGSDSDPTRPARFYDETYNYLLEAGIRKLSDCLQSS